MGREMKFRPSEAAHNPPLAELLQLDDAQFRARFKGSPIKRIGRDRFLRNVLVAAGNSGDRTLLEGVVALLDDASPIVRGMAIWASRQLANADEETVLRERFSAKECDLQVRSEWDAAL
jgi:epoxyqueuosine reductase